MRRTISLIMSFLLFTLVLPAQQKPALLPARDKAKTAIAVSEGESASASAEPSSARLPVRRVVLYKNGVGYFEHTGMVHGSQHVDVDFTTAQLNDALKSLTVVDL